LAVGYGARIRESVELHESLDRGRGPRSDPLRGGMAQEPIPRTATALTLAKFLAMTHAWIVRFLARSRLFRRFLARSRLFRRFLRSRLSEKERRMRRPGGREEPSGTELERGLLRLLESRGYEDPFGRARLGANGGDCRVVGPPETIALLLVLRDTLVGPGTSRACARRSLGGEPPGEPPEEPPEPTPGSDTLEREEPRTGTRRNRPRQTDPSERPQSLPGDHRRSGVRGPSGVRRRRAQKGRPKKVFLRARG